MRCLPLPQLERAHPGDCRCVPVSVFLLPRSHRFHVYGHRFCLGILDAAGARHGYGLDAGGLSHQVRPTDRRGLVTDPGHLRVFEEPICRNARKVADAMTPEILGIILIGCMLFAILIGFPISFTLIFLGLVFGYIGFGKLVFYLMAYQFFGVMMEQTLAAVPLFVFMGILME